MEPAAEQIDDMPGKEVLKRRHIAAATIGNALEFYDFLNLRLLLDSNRPRLFSAPKRVWKSDAFAGDLRSRLCHPSHWRIFHRQLFGPRRAPASHDAVLRADRLRDCRHGAYPYLRPDRDRRADSGRDCPHATGVFAGWGDRLEYGLSVGGRSHRPARPDRRMAGRQPKSRAHRRRLGRRVSHNGAAAGRPGSVRLAYRVPARRRRGPLRLVAAHQPAGDPPCARTWPYARTWPCARTWPRPGSNAIARAPGLHALAYLSRWRWSCSRPEPLGHTFLPTSSLTRRPPYT